ncbi:hypothetical protein, partial [Mycobacterium avium]
MATTWILSKGLAAVVTASVAALGLCPGAAADPAAAPQPAPPPNAAPQLPGLPALSQLSPLIQQAATDPQQATQLLMAAAQAFSHNPTAPTESKNVAAAVNQFVAEPGSPVPNGVTPPDGAPVQHVPATGIEPGLQAHLPTGIDPAHAAGPAPAAAAPSAPAPAATPPSAPAPAAAPAPGPVQPATVPAAAPVPPPPAPAAAAPATPGAPDAAPAPAAAPGFGADAPPTQDFMYPSIGTNC